MTRLTVRPKLKGGAAALALLLSLAPAAPAQAPADDFERGKQLLAQGNVPGATAAFKRATGQRKADAEVWYSLGIALGRDQNPKEARKAFERAAKLRPTWADAHAGLAFSLLRLGKPRDAEKSARRALAADPQHAEAHYVLAYLRFDEEKFAEALAEADAALRSRPEFAAAAHLASDALLNVYVEESARLGREHPIPPATSPEVRKALLIQRDAALAPLKGRIREMAERLDAFAAALPGAPDAESWREQAEALRLYGRPASEGGYAGLVPSDQLTTKAVILSKPEPSYTERARKNNVTGRVRLRAVLAADGQVRHIVASKRLPDGLTEKCISAARLIRFKPATLDGRPVSQYVVLEYNFNVY
jgi:TonB family protein